MRFHICIIFMILIPCFATLQGRAVYGIRAPWTLCTLCFPSSPWVCVVHRVMSASRASPLHSQPWSFTFSNSLPSRTATRTLFATASGWQQGREMVTGSEERVKHQFQQWLGRAGGNTLSAPNFTTSRLAVSLSEVMCADLLITLSHSQKTEIQ